MKPLLILLVLTLALGITGAANAKDEGWLGVMLQPLTDDLIEAMNLGRDIEGVLVSDVVGGSPAEAAGIEKGDVITEVDGTSIISTEGAIEKVRSFAPGDKVKLVVLRDGKKEVVTAVLGKRETDIVKEVTRVGEGEEDDQDYYNLKIPRMEKIFRDFRPEPGGHIGVRIQDISADLGSYFGVGCCEGVLILDVEEDSPAASAGLKAGDVVIKVDGKDVTSTGEFASYIRDVQPGRTVELTLKRNKETRRISVEVAEGPDASRVFIERMGKPDVRMMRGGCCLPGKEPMGMMERMEPPVPGEPMMMRDNLRQEIDHLRQEIEALRQEIDGLKK